MNKLVKQAGISLVEVMVALVISIFLLAGIVQVYVGNKSTFAFTNALAEIQENGRFALDTMSQDFRLVGEWGCVRFPPVKASDIDNTLSAATVTGWSAATHNFESNDPIGGTNDGGLNGSDTVTVMSGKPGTTQIEGPFSAEGGLSIITNAVNSISTGDIVLLARCGADDLPGKPDAEIKVVTNIVNISSDAQRRFFFATGVSQQYENDATLIPLQTVTYSIAPGASGAPALWRSEFTNNVELVEHVENMQILYGYDSDGDAYPNQYLTVDNVPDLNAVVSVRIMLLIQSNDLVAETPQPYTFNNVTTTPTDNRIRQVFTTTVAFRNKIGG